MVFDFFPLVDGGRVGLGCGRATTLEFNQFVLTERRAVRADVLLMSFNTFDEIDLGFEAFLGKTKEPPLAGEVEFVGRLRRLSQLSLDDGCTVFCAVRTVFEGKKSLSVAVAHHGKLVDIACRALAAKDEYTCSNALKIYSSPLGKMAVLIDSDAIEPHLWNKIALADHVFCFVTTDEYTQEITRLALKQRKPAIILTKTTASTVEL